MEGSQAILIAGLIAGGLLALGIALVLIAWVVRGALELFGMAAAQGFVGLVAYVAAWVFLLPVMAVASGVIGFFAWRMNRAEEKAQSAQEKPRRKKRAPPPDDPYERHLWANRLPPYDKD
ncbi:MAG: hypothetical protein ACQEUZ_02305 [Pseudomonadota bacterium]